MSSALLSSVSGPERSPPADAPWLAGMSAGCATLSKCSNAATTRAGRARACRVRLRFLLAAFGLEDSVEGMDHPARPPPVSLVWLSHPAGHRFRDQARHRALRAVRARSPPSPGVAAANSRRFTPHSDLSGDRHGRRDGGAGGAAPGAGAMHVVGTPADERLSDHRFLPLKRPDGAC